MTIIIVRTLLTVFALGGVVYTVNAAGLIEVFQWKQMDFYNRGDSATPVYNGVDKPDSTNRGSIVFPGPYSHSNRRRVRASEVHTSRDDPADTELRFGNVHHGTAASNGSYIAYNNVPMGATHHKGRLFITMPRRRVGIPSTLNYVDMRKDGNQRSPKLHAYPDLETNTLGNNFTAIPNHIISVYRTTADACERLWFVDTGMLEYPNNRMQVQRPTIWIVNLATDRVLRRFEIPQSTVETGRGLASITVDTHSKACDKAFAYIPDLVNNQLYVYSYETNRMWSFSHNYFNFDPLAGDFDIAGQRFRWDDGIFSATMGPSGADGHREVYFHAMASNNEFVVSSAVLQNESNAARSDHGQDFRLLGHRGDRRQSTMHVYDPRTDVLFYAEIQRSGVGCWNTHKSFTPANHGTVAADPERMIYPSDLTIDDTGVIWVMTNSMPIFIYSTLDPNIVNFRVWKQDVFTAAKDTVCQ